MSVAVKIGDLLPSPREPPPKVRLLRTCPRLSYDDGFTLSDAPATVCQIYYPGVKSDDLTLPFLLRVPVTLRVLLTDGRCTGNRY